MSTQIYYTCPCCGKKTKTVSFYGPNEICPVCFWEDDELKIENPGMAGGANLTSLREARKNFKKYSACEIAMAINVVKDRLTYEIDKNWQPSEE